LLEHLTPAEKRKLLFASRLRFGIESQVPRQMALDRIIENALLLARKDEWFNAHQVMDVFKDIGGLPTLRIHEIEQGLQRLQSDGRARRRQVGLSAEYQLSKSAMNDVEGSYQEGTRRFERVLRSLFGDLEGTANDGTLTSIFLEFTCEVFSALGAQWATYLKGDPLHSLIDLAQVENIASNKVRKYGIESPLAGDITRRCIKFLQQTDPDYDFLKFTLGQSFYIMHLLGVEGKDMLSQDIFSGGKLYLDSSVVIAATLAESRHYKVFHELTKICKRLGVTLLVARPTADEVRAVAAQQEEIAPLLYDNVPEKLSQNVSGDFFETYRSMKSAVPEATTEDLFKPFHTLSSTLSTNFGIAVVDDKQFEEVTKRPEFAAVMDVLQDSSKEVRHRPKFKNALAHDAKVFLFLRSEIKAPGDKVWMVTRDSSLPRAWSRLQPSKLAIRCFLLDGLLQSISPFATDEGEIKDMSEVFSQVVGAQLVPQGKIFEIDDFMLFQELDLDCRQMPVEEIEEGLLAVKQRVLKGAAYRRENLEEAAYELRRVFSRRDERLGTISLERDGLEQKISQMEADHRKEVTDLHSKLRGLEEKQTSRDAKWRNFVLLTKKALTLLVLIVSYYYVGKAAQRWGEGHNIFQKILTFLPYFAIDTAVMLGAAKLLLFRGKKLTDVFKLWSELKELLK